MSSDSHNCRYRSDVTATLIRSSAQDADVVWAAKVSTLGERALVPDEALTSQSAGKLIDYLMDNRHGSPFEHNSFTFFIEAPIFVMREFQRHRVGHSYNEESARYREMKPVFYIPGDDRLIMQFRDAKPGRYELTPGSRDAHHVVNDATRRACEVAYAEYRLMLDMGVAREVARGVLPVATFSSMYHTCNARSLMHFLSLRTSDSEAQYTSTPQREIEMVADQMEEAFAAAMPLTHAAWQFYGRVAP